MFMSITRHPSVPYAKGRATHAYRRIHSICFQPALPSRSLAWPARFGGTSPTIPARQRIDYLLPLGAQSSPPPSPSPERVGQSIPERGVRARQRPACQTGLRRRRRMLCDTFLVPAIRNRGRRVSERVSDIHVYVQPADSKIYAAAGVRFSSSGLPPHRGRNESLTAGGHAPRLWPSPSPASVPLRLGLVVPPPSVSSVSAGLVTRDKSVSSQYDPQGCCAPLRADIEPALGFRVGLDAGRHAAQAQAVRT